MNFLRKFGEIDFRSDLISMLENINDILEPYRDDHDILLGLMKPGTRSYAKISNNVKLSLDLTRTSDLFTYNFHSEVIIAIMFKIEWVVNPSSSPTQYSYSYTKPMGEIFDRLNLEYSNMFEIDHARIISIPIKYKN